MSVTANALATEIVRELGWARADSDRQSLAWKEWLVTNGLGGYASGTVSGALTRRYHALLVAASADAVRPHGDAELRLGAPALAGWPRPVAAEGGRDERGQ